MKQIAWIVAAAFFVSAVGCELKKTRIRIGKEKPAKNAVATKENPKTIPSKQVPAENEMAGPDTGEPVRSFKPAAFGEQTGDPLVVNSSNFFTKFPESGGGGAASGLGGSMPGSYPGMSPTEAIDKLLREIKDGLAQRGTLVVWLVDNSKSAEDLVSQCLGRLKAFYQTESQPGLLTAIGTFGGEVKFMFDEPTADVTKISTAFDALGSDSSGKELIFAAVKQACERYGKLRSPKQDVVIAILTDEAGDDENAVDDAIKIPKAKLMPVYVLGVPAPLGKATGGGNSVEAPADFKPVAGGWLPTKQGPDARRADWIDFNTGGGGGFGANASTVFDSNFGPFALERLCRATGGKYLAVRSGAGAWPGNAPRFDPEVMRKYAPDYLAEADYQAKVAGNKAKQAVLKAAELGPINLAINLPLLTFPVKGSEAQMKRSLDDAQRGPAKLEQPINSLYEILKEGEADRDALDSPRWQAAFDSAYGRVLAAKARVEGYNEMLAALKRGKVAKNASSNFWSLEPADKTEAASQIASMSERAKTYLTRVATEHKGTPWAMLAERELQTQLGWQWVER